MTTRLVLIATAPFSPTFVRWTGDTRGRKRLADQWALYCELRAPLVVLFCQYGSCRIDDWKERPVGKATETDLPGVGVRFDLETNAGRCVGVVVHQTGRRDLVVYDERDVDRACESVVLTEDEGHTLGELLGGNPVLEHLDDAVHRLEDLVISWVTIDSKSSLAGLTLAEAELRARTGAASSPSSPTRAPSPSRAEPTVSSPATPQWWSASRPR